MEKKNKKLKIIVIIIAVLLIAITAVLVINNKREIQNNIDGTVQEDSTEFVKSKEKVNAYEYIINTMNEPEFWDEEMAMEYWTRYLSDEEISERKEKIPNGSGWNLSDVSKAEFSRGHDYTLYYDFANFKAVRIDDVIVYEYDFKNDKYICYPKSDSTNIYESSELEYAPNGDIYYIGNVEESYRSFIKNSMMNYAYLFELAGCPILLQPEGTLESYKNLEINPIENYKRSGWSNGNYYELRNQYDHMELDPENPNLTVDGWLVKPYMKGENKIDYVWEQEGYEYDIRNKDDLQWTDDYTQVLEVANNLPSKIISSTGEDLSQAVMVFVNTQKYETDKQYDNYKGMYPNITSNMFTYMARPILQKIYGKDVTYYCDSKKVENNSFDGFMISDEMFKNIGLFQGADSGDTVYCVWKTMSWGKDYNARIWPFMFDDIDAGDLFEPFYQYKDLCTAAGIEWPYSGLYPMTYLLTVDSDYQELFGLR